MNERSVLGYRAWLGIAAAWLSFVPSSADTPDATHAHHHAKASLKFSVRSTRDGDWSNPRTWDTKRVPARHDRVLVSRGTNVRYDVIAKDVLRMVHVVGTLEFARDCDTELNVAVLKVQNSDTCTESGFACEFDGQRADGPAPALIIGTQENPIPPDHVARIRLHYIEGMNEQDTPAIACCSARMELHGSPLNRTWLKLGDNTQPGDQALTLSETVNSWQVGDEVIVTASHRDDESQTENRRITHVAGNEITLDKPLKYEHFGRGEFRSEVANLSRNVIVESADPDGVRGHTVYHRESIGGISYARFAHLGKRGVLGRYAIHYHLVGDSMRGSSVLGVAIVDSHNRWVTIHGTRYLVVRDCVGHQSIGHGFFLEDGTEIYNLLDRNLAIGAKRGRRLPDQVLSFDPNDGAGFWWANGRNSFTRNVSCENEEYGYRYDMQKTSRSDSQLPIVQPDGTTKSVDVRTIPIWRFENNEAHTEGFYGLVVAANGNRQPDNAIRDQKMLQRIRAIDWTGPDRRHPHRIKNFTVWNAHYAFRPHSPNMWMENIRLHGAAYGVYRPAFDGHVYRNLHITNMDAEPFNRGMDDASAQTGVITVDGLTFGHGYGNKSTPLVQISDLNLSGDAATHFRNVTIHKPEQFRDRWPLINRGVGPRVPPITGGVPIYIHDHFGKGRHAKVVSTAACDLLADGNKYHPIPTITGDESLAAEVTDIEWPDKVLQPVDDQPPATIITAVSRVKDGWLISGVSHDNGNIDQVVVNGEPAEMWKHHAGVCDWTITLNRLQGDSVTAAATDDSGNRERTPHVLTVR